MELQKLMNEISEWSDKEFGNGQRNPAILHHLKKEVIELIEAINKFEKIRYDDSVGVGEYGRKIKNVKIEFADCFMLILDSASHFNLTARDLVMDTKDKLEINKTRKWGNPDKNGVVEHVQ